MRRFVRSKTKATRPQSAAVTIDGQLYIPVFWHTAIDQDHPIGSKATFTEHIHDLYHIVLYTKGGGFYSKEGRFYPADAGTCVLIRPGQRHDFVSRLGSSVYSEITFSYENEQNNPLRISFEKLLSVYSGMEIRLTHKRTFSEEDQQIQKNLFIQITDYLNSPKELSDYYVHRTLGQIFDFLIEHYMEYKKSEVITDRFLRSQMWIEEHYTETVSMDQLVKIAGISRGYFFRGFKKTFGISPLAYQQQLRIEAAKTLLRATYLNCKEIGRRVGFADVYFFYRTFKKHTGKTPNQYRRG